MCNILMASIRNEGALKVTDDSYCTHRLCSVSSHHRCNGSMTVIVISHVP
jgi:hypothetical protein